MKTFLYLIIMCTPCWLSAQLHIQRGSNINIQGDAKIVLHNTSFLNDGNFTAGNSTVIFTGQDKAFVGGSARTAFFNLSLNEAQLSGDILITGRLLLNQGNLELDKYHLDLGSTGTIEGEKPNARITGSAGGIVTATALLSAPAHANPGNIGIDLSSNANLGFTTITRGHVQQTNAEGRQSIQRYYDVQPAINTNNIALKLHYFEPELAGNDEANLVLWQLKNNRFTLGAGKAMLTAYPNPARDRLTLTLFSNADKRAFINLQDARGQVLERRQVNLTEGLNTLQWNIAMYAAGTYYLVMENSDVKIIKQ